MQPCPLANQVNYTGLGCLACTESQGNAQASLVVRQGKKREIQIRAGAAAELETLVQESGVMRLFYTPLRAQVQELFLPMAARAFAQEPAWQGFPQLHNSYKPHPRYFNT